MEPILLASAFLAVWGLLLLLKRLLRPNTLSDIRGPPSPSFFFGHEYQLLNQDEAGDFDFKHLGECGTVWKAKTCLDVDNLVVADPLAVQHILHASRYMYPKRADISQNLKLVLGDGIVVAVGDTHSRQKKAMNPAFSASQLKTIVPVFQRSVDHLCRKLKVDADKINGESSINLASLLSRYAFFLLGRPALNYEFDALDEVDGPFVKAFNGLHTDSGLYPRNGTSCSGHSWLYFPQWFLNLVQYTPIAEYIKLRHFVKLAKSTAKKHIEERKDVVLEEEEKGRKDVFSLLVRANKDEEAKYKMSEDEIYCQFSTMVLAGHDTTANTIPGRFTSAANAPKSSTGYALEIMAARQEHGIIDDEAALDTHMLVRSLRGKLLVLILPGLQESCRLHPIFSTLAREAGQDDVIPLSFPIQTQSGALVDSITVRKGQSIGISVCAYNRIRAIWGEDAHEWNRDSYRLLITWLLGAILNLG
ncbi:cytochrome P450 [Pterulicium gracile]|uniref:Cytochrome P450 n=1 Tax=Pterulicium gracile TaxID=1884261 RepID=A0A5C3Q2E7_9AGAR|nr:cytochrome P450 [Pterula gracilis]